MHLAVLVRCPTCRQAAIEIWVEPVSGRRFEARSDAERARIRREAPSTAVDELANRTTDDLKRMFARQLAIAEETARTSPDWMRQRVADRRRTPWCADHGFTLSLADRRRLDVACQPIKVENLTPVASVELVAGTLRPLILIGKRSG